MVGQDSVTERIWNDSSLISHVLKRKESEASVGPSQAVPIKSLDRLDILHVHILNLIQVIIQTSLRQNLSQHTVQSAKHTLKMSNDITVKKQHLISKYH